MINNRSFAAGASPRPTSKPIISPFAEHQFDRFKQTDKPQFEVFRQIDPRRCDIRGDEVVEKMLFDIQIGIYRGRAKGNF